MSCGRTVWVLVSFLFRSPSLQGAAQPVFPGARTQTAAAKPGLGLVINPKTIMETSEPVITPDINVSDSDI